MQANNAFIPQTTFDGPVLEFDFPAMQVGIAEYAEGPTGCTVFAFPEGIATAVDVRGGMVGKTGDYGWNHAICFAGGSLYGLQAVSGVAEALSEQHAYSLEKMPLVSGAIIYDFGARENVIYPDHKLGRAALEAARPGRFSLGARGAGRSAACGKIFAFHTSEESGQGGAFRQVGPTKIGVFTVVNALGAVFDRQGQVVRGNRDPQTGLRQHPIVEMEQRLARGESIASPFGNTTLTLVVTNQKLRTEALQQLGRQVHTSMARAIQPFHTINDGDVLYTVTTNEVENVALGGVSLGIVAAELAWDAILASSTTLS